MRKVFIVSEVGAPSGKFGGKLAGITSPDLGLVAAKSALEWAAVDPAQVEEAIFGSARQAAMAPIRLARYRFAGIPKGAPAYTVNQASASDI